MYTTSSRNIEKGTKREYLTDEHELYCKYKVIYDRLTVSGYILGHGALQLTEC